MNTITLVKLSNHNIICCEEQILCININGNSKCDSTLNVQRNIFLPVIADKTEHTELTVYMIQYSAEFPERGLSR